MIERSEDKKERLLNVQNNTLTFIENVVYDHHVEKEKHVNKRNKRKKF